MNLTHNNINISSIDRLHKLIPWFVLRFFHIRVLFNWAWDPDEFDFLASTTQYGIYKKTFLGKILVGGYRLTVPTKRLDESMTAKLEFFRAMVPVETWEVLEKNHDLCVEASRFVIAFYQMFDKKFIRESTRLSTKAIARAQDKHMRPFLLLVVNPFLYSHFKKSGLVLKELGGQQIKAASFLERMAFGKIVPHYVLLINSLASQELSIQGKLAMYPPEFIFDNTDSTPLYLADRSFKERATEVWELIK